MGSVGLRESSDRFQFWEIISFTPVHTNGLAAFTLSLGTPPKLGNMCYIRRPERWGFGKRQIRGWACILGPSGEKRRTGRLA